MRIMAATFAAAAFAAAAFAATALLLCICCYCCCCICCCCCLPVCVSAQMLPLLLLPCLLPSPAAAAAAPFAVSFFKYTALINASFWLSSESSKQRKSREQQQTRKGLLACLRCLAREKRGGVAACRLGTCVIGGGGLVAWARQIWSSARRTRGLASCDRATIVACIRITSHEPLQGARPRAAAARHQPLLPSWVDLLWHRHPANGQLACLLSLAFCCKGCLQKGLMRPQAPAGIHPPTKRAGARRTSLGSSGGPPRPKPRRGHQR